MSCRIRWRRARRMCDCRIGIDADRFRAAVSILPWILPQYPSDVFLRRDLSFHPSVHDHPYRLYRH